MSYRTVDIFRINRAKCAQEELTGPAWRMLLDKAGDLEDFWAQVVQHLIVIANASNMKPANA